MSKAQKLFENVIDQDVIDSLTDEQVDELLKMLENI
jgi:NADH:ubiquinone oxidoreductase subunit E